VTGARYGPHVDNEGDLVSGKEAHE
jgi:hypothetical protein